MRPSGLPESLSPGDFAITNSDYGRAGALYRCRECGFLACLDMGEVLSHYEALEDPEYEAGRDERAMQSDRLLSEVEQHVPQGRLLDVGAGAGITVERALARGWDAEGVEPSAWLCERATERGLPVHRGTLPHPDVAGPYDAVVLVDVVEHVTAPVELLREAAALLAPGGAVFVVTPDVASFAARLLGRRWWHVRVAHVGYFTKPTLSLALARAGLQAVAFSRPGWHFRLDYLVPRVHHYLPRWLRIPLPRALSEVTVPLNLFDSLLAVATRPEA